MIINIDGKSPKGRISIVISEGGNTAEMSLYGPSTYLVVGDTYNFNDQDWTLQSTKPSPYVKGVLNAFFVRNE